MGGKYKGEDITLCEAPVGAAASVQVLDWLIGYGVREVISCAAQEFVYDILLRVGKQASTKVLPNYDVKTTYLRTPTDELRKEFKMKNEKKPKQSVVDKTYKREVVITMKDMMACKKFLPERSLHVYEKKKYESMK